MRNMLVKGRCRYSGSNFFRYLLRESDFSGRVVTVDNLTSAGNPENLSVSGCDLPGRYLSIKADICDRECMPRISNAYEMDTVCPLAAESRVDRPIVKKTGVRP